MLTSACGSSSKPSSPATNPNATEVVPPGDIPDNQVFVRYVSPAGGYSLRYPEGWAEQHSGDATTFTQHYNQITVSTSRSSTPPTKASVAAVDVSKLRSSPGFKLVRTDSVTRPAGKAIRIQYETTSATDPVTGKRVALDVERYLFWRRDRLVTITLATPHGSDNVDAWRMVTSSLAWR
jgi:hypothetical protein